MKAKFIRKLLTSVSIMALLACTTSPWLTSIHAKAETPANILAGKTGAKVAAPTDDYSRYTRYGIFSSEGSANILGKLTDGATNVAKASSSKFQYLNTTTLKVGVMYELGGLYDVSSIKAYLPSDAVYGTDLLRGLNVYAGTDPATLCQPANLFGSVTDNHDKAITITLSELRSVKYVVFLFTDMGGENNAYLTELELYGTPSPDQAPNGNENLTKGKTPQVWLTDSTLASKMDANGKTSGIAGFTDGLFPSTLTQIYGNVNASNQFSTHILEFDLGDSYEVSCVHVPYYLSDTASNLLSSWDVYTSDTLSALYDAGNRITGKTSSRLRVMTAQFTPRSARYVAIVLQYPAGIYTSKVFEIEVYGSPRISTAQITGGQVSISKPDGAIPGDQAKVIVNPSVGKQLKAGGLYYKVEGSEIIHPVLSRDKSVAAGNTFLFAYPSEKITVYADFVAADALNISTMGAQIRDVDAGTNEARSIRFGSRLYGIGADDTFRYNGETYTIQECGTLIFPKKYLTDPGNLNELAVVESGKINGKSVLKIPSVNTHDSTEAYLDFTGVMVNLRAGWEDEPLIARAYVLAQDSVGNPQYFYSNAIERTINGVRSAAI